MEKQETQEMDDMEVPVSEEEIESVKAQLDAMAKDINSGAKPAGQAAPASGAKKENPFDRFYVVELHFSGLTGKATYSDDHILSAFMRMGESQRNRMQYLKVDFYRTCKKLATFKLNNQYVLKRENLGQLDAKFKEIYEKFLVERNTIYKQLTVNWDQILADVSATHPSLQFDPEDIDKLRPTSPEFMDMGYDFRSMANYLQELKTLKDSFLSTNDPDVAKRLETQRQLVESQVRAGYEDIILKMSTQIEKLKKYVVKKGKRLENGLAKIEDMKESAINMADLLGEKDAVAMKIEAMMEGIATMMKQPEPPKP